MTIAKLPFELSPDATSLWLQSLSKTNSANSAIELSTVTKLLRKNKADANAVLSVLNTLIPTILHVSDNIEASVLTEPGSKKSAPKIIKLCIQLLRNTGLAFCNISDKKSLSDNQKSLVIYSALQLIGYSQRLSTLFFELPSSSLWGESGRVYNLAIQADFTQQQINHKIRHFKNQTTIESVLKRNLLFNISNPQQYSANQIIELFIISDQLSDKLALNPSYSATADTFHWNSRSKNTPLAINSAQQEQNLTTLINTGELIYYIQSKKFCSNLDQQALTRLIEHLSGYQSIINSIIPSAPTISHLLIGFSDITEYLVQTDKLKKIQKLSGQPATNQQIENIALEPMPFEKNNLKPIFRTPSSISTLNLLAKAKTVKTLQVQNNKYIIAETSYLNCSIGDLCLFCSSNLTHILGIIRQVKITNVSKTVHILIEKTAGIPSTHQFTSPQLTENKILSIKTADTEADFFISQCKFSGGTQLTATSGEQFILNKLIDYSPFFSRYHSLICQHFSGYEST
jgi:hypothetical protein